ncbi:(p)ppGpp synthetase, partial [Alkalihalophilus pseudofirmus]|nr:(p)ppGpp synthetase [Alkalihalophilus pseudofirmus]
FDTKEILTSDNLKKVAEKFNFMNEEDMYAAAGYNGVTALQIANRLTEKWRKKRDQEQSASITKAITDLKAFPSTKKR